jgi:CheY-like chemotaxis protein
MSYNVLVVEDDDYKATDICKVIEEQLLGVAIVKVASATSALFEISEGEFDLVVLDMSLPTFDLSSPGGGGSPQSQGGIEVLRLARRLQATLPFIVVTQYPDVEFDGLEVPLAEAAARLSARFNANVMSCIAYEFDRGSWRPALTASLNIFRDGQDTNL